nr:GtrA family protein [Alkalibacterium sp. MB6]
MKDLFDRYGEIINYLIFGVATTVVNIVVFFLFDTILSVPYLIANAIAIILSILFAFFTNKKYVFKSQAMSRQGNWEEFVRFVSFRVLSGLFDMLSMWILVDMLLFGTNLAKLLTQFIVVVLNYVFSKFFVFKQEEE